jgi:hypothetical protein
VTHTVAIHRIHRGTVHVPCRDLAMGRLIFQDAVEDEQTDMVTLSDAQGGQLGRWVRPTSRFKESH